MDALAKTISKATWRLVPFLLLTLPADATASATLDLKVLY
jgi:hypothetical protein